MERKKSMGGWGLINPGLDPFSDEAVRNIALRDSLMVQGETDIEFVSLHDRDIWPDDASWQQITDAIGQAKQWMAEAGLEILNFTTNLFSHRCFRSGAFSSPYAKVREAAIVKAMQGVDAAHAFGAKNIIFWGGREGTNGDYTQDTGTGLRLYMQGIRACIMYAQAKGYQFTFTIEPKVYEPMLAGLYAGTGTAAASAIRAFLPEYLDVTKINPEYPQHVAMVGLDPVIELGQLLEEGMLAPFIHFGGQITGRMDCDLPPGFGGNMYVDLAICRTLRHHNWDGIIEGDWRMVRTSTTLAALRRALDHFVWYWDRLEAMVDAQLGTDWVTTEEDSSVLAAVNQASPETIISAAQYLRDKFTGFGSAAEVDTDGIEERWAETLQGIMQNW